MQPKSNIRGELNPVSYAEAPELGAFVDYWHSKSVGGALPRRTDINPAEIKNDLGSLFIAEPLNDGQDFRYRLVGADLTIVFGKEFTGTTVRQMSPPMASHDMEGILAAYTTVTRKRAVLRASGRILWAQRDYLQFDSIHVPVESPAGGAVWIIGKIIVVAASTAGRIPASLQQQWVSHHTSRRNHA